MYEDIIRQYRDLDDRLADFHYKVKSEDNYETVQLIPSEENYEALKAELAGVQDERHRRLLEMRSLAGWSVERIAEERGLSVAKVKVDMAEAEKSVEKGTAC